MQTRWKSIRDRHTRYLRQTKTTKSGSAANPKKNYVYGKLLDFLQSTIVHNLTQDSHVEEEDGSNNDPDEIEKTPQTHHDEVIPSTSTEYRRKKRKMEDKFEKYLEVVTRRELEKCEDEDEDKSFFTSLIPSVKRLTATDKMQFKADVMQLLISYTNKPQLQHSQYPVPPHRGPQHSNAQMCVQYGSNPTNYYPGPPQNFQNVCNNQSQYIGQGTVTQDDHTLNNISEIPVNSPETSDSLLSLN